MGKGVMIKRMVFLGVVFVAGAVVMALEILASRALAPDFGGSVYVWGAIIAVFMTALSVGYAIGGRMADRQFGYGGLTFLFAIPALWLAVYPIYGRVIPRAIAMADWDPRWGVALVAWIMFAVPVAALGAVTPFISRLMNSDMENVGARVGDAMAAATVGSVLGTLFTAFYLIQWIGTTRGVQALAAPLALIAITFIALSIRGDR